MRLSRAYPMQVLVMPAVPSSPNARSASGSTCAPPSSGVLCRAHARGRTPRHAPSDVAPGAPRRPPRGARATPPGPTAAAGPDRPRRARDDGALCASPRGRAGSSPHPAERNAPARARPPAPPGPRHPWGWGPATAPGAGAPPLAVAPAPHQPPPLQACAPPRWLTAPPTPASAPRRTSLAADGVRAGPRPRPATGRRLPGALALTPQGHHALATEAPPPRGPVLVPAPPATSLRGGTAPPARREPAPDDGPPAGRRALEAACDGAHQGGRPAPCLQGLVERLSGPRHVAPSALQALRSGAAA